MVVEEGRIQSVRSIADTPREAQLHPFGDLVLLPGLVDSHVHINEPGRTEWEGFATATRAAAAGGYTTLVDMPLNCLPETTTVAALEAKRHAAAGQCHVDWAPWGGLTGLNSGHLAPLAEAGVAGFKCFLINPGIEGFAMIEKHELEAALPILARIGLPLLVHAELAEHLDPGQSYFQIDYNVVYATQRPLYGYMPDNGKKFIPDLAAGMPVISKDGKTGTVHIKPNVKWSPPLNRTVTSADV